MPFGGGSSIQELGYTAAVCCLWNTHHLWVPTSPIWFCLGMCLRLCTVPRAGLPSFLERGSAVRAQRSIVEDAGHTFGFSLPHLEVFACFLGLVFTPNTNGLCTHSSLVAFDTRYIASGCRRSYCLKPRMFVQSGKHIGKVVPAWNAVPCPYLLNSPHEVTYRAGPGGGYAGEKMCMSLLCILFHLILRVVGLFGITPARGLGLGG